MTKRAEDSATKQVIFNRPPRVYPVLPVHEFTIAPPPTRSGRPQRVNLVGVVLPVLLMALSSITMLQSNNANRNLLLLSLGGMAGLSIVGAFASNWWERRYQRREEVEREQAYEQMLHHQRDELERLRKDQQHIRCDNDPDLERVLAVARQRESRLWERRPVDPDFLSLRIGVGELPSTVKVVPPKLDHPGAQLQQALNIAHEYRMVHNVPLTVPLRDLGSVGIAGGISGDGDTGAQLLRALLLHLVVHHAPDEVRIAAIIPPDLAAEWSWLADLPHTRPLQQDVRTGLVATTPEAGNDLMTLLLDELSQRDHAQRAIAESDPNQPLPPQIVLVLIGRDAVLDHVTTGYMLRRGKDLRASVICLVSQRRHIPGDVGAIIEIVGVAQANFAVAGGGRLGLSCIPDMAPHDECAQTAQALTAIRVRSTHGAGDLRAEVRLLDLLGIDLARYDATTTWQQPPFGWLRTPLGQQIGGQELLFDLVEYGPHGVIAGTTGSGKSELLVSMIAGLALTHHPHQLNFVLVDFKGGSSLGIFEHLPHTVGLITNLHGRLVERALNAFDAELKRRQRIIVEAGTQTISQYRRQQLGVVMPELLIIIDEFAELAAEMPDFMGRLISIARIGRTLGVHLLLAAQRPAGVVNADMWSNLKYRISLRVETHEDSREMLGRPDAALLPHNRPGRGYFQVGQIFQLFQTARVTASYTGTLPDCLTDAGASATTRAAEQTSAPQIKDLSDAQAIVKVLAHAAQHLPRLQGPWSPPLQAQVPLGTIFKLLQPATATTWQELQGWSWRAVTAESWLQAPIGLVDDLAAQQHMPLVIDLQNTGTHLLVAGSAGSGKSTLVRTLVTSLALTHNPSNVWFYLIDLGGQGLAPLRELPHVADLFRPNEQARIGRLLRHLRSEIEARKALLGNTSASNLWQYRMLNKDTPLPALIVVIDNFGGFRETFEDDLPTLYNVARDGKAVGIHLVLTTDRPSVVPSALISNIEWRLALRLTDAQESSALLNKPDAAQITTDTPGRGFLAGRQLQEFQTALPVARLEEDSPEALPVENIVDEDTQISAIKALGTRMKSIWRGGTPPPIKLLAEHITLQQLLAAASKSLVHGLGTWRPVPIAEDDQSLLPIAVDIDRDGPHLLAIGTSASGKSVLLRAWTVALAECATPNELQLVLIGLRRSLQPLRRLPHILEGGYISSPARLDSVILALHQEWQRRNAALQTLIAHSDDQDLEIPQLNGARLVVVVDDIELLLSVASYDAKNMLIDVLKGSRDLGIHLIAAGNAEDLARTYSDSLLDQLRTWRAGAILRLVDADHASLLGVRLPYNIQFTDYPAGRGWLVNGGMVRLVQFATADGSEPDAAFLRSMIEQIRTREEAACAVPLAQ